MDTIPDYTEKFPNIDKSPNMKHGLANEAPEQSFRLNHYYNIHVFPAISSSFCYDVEIEGVMKVGAEFLKVLDQNANIARQLTLTSQSEPKDTLPSLSKNKFDAAAERSSANDINGIYTMNLEDFTLHLRQQAEKTFKIMGKQILYDLNLSKKNISSLVKDVTIDYTTLLQKYYAFLANDPNIALVENDFLFLDMVETHCQLLHNGEKQILDGIISEHAVEPKTVQAVQAKISKHIIVEKKEKLSYICEKYKICKEYSTFSDRCGDLISLLLKLPEAKFYDFVRIMYNILKKHENVLENIVEKRDRKLLLTKLRTISSNVFALKEFLALLRVVISPKIKADAWTDKTQRHRTIAARILFDIIDKAVNWDESLLDIDFDHTILAINNWSNDMSRDVAPLPGFVDNTIRTFNHRITKGGRKEIKVLITTILGRQTKDDETFANLLTHGSNFVKGNDLNDFHLDIDDGTFIPTF